MNKLKIFLLAFIGCIIFVACGSDDEPTPTPEGETREISYEIPANGCVNVLSLEFMPSEPIASISNTPDWLSVTAEPFVGYSSPRIRIKVQENKSNSERKASVIITNNRKEYRLILNIAQKAAEKQDPSDDPTDDPTDDPSDDPTENPTEMGCNNTTSNNPAYIPQKR